MNWEEISFGVITASGSAKTQAMNAIKKAKEGDFDAAAKTLVIAEEELTAAKKFHMDVISKVANDEKVDYNVLFMHAEDQMMNTEVIILMAHEFVELYKKLKK